jgi:hypothetical protein
VFDTVRVIHHHAAHVQILFIHKVNSEILCVLERSCRSLVF